jgi:hypothetical protein
VYFSPNIVRVIKSRRMVSGGHKCNKDLIGEREGKGRFGLRRHKWEDNIKTNVKEIRYEGVV